jgi:HEAT repeat protein
VTFWRLQIDRASSHTLSDPSPKVSTSAQRALIAIGPAAVPRLCQLLYRGSTAVRELAAGALGAIGDPRAIEPLSQALAIDETPVRIAAARSLGQIADRFPAPELCQAVPTLRRLLTRG